MSRKSRWDKAQKWEKDWWGNCINTYGEETKQFLYAEKMGLQTFHDGKSPFNFNLEGKSVLDIGGGPSSLLLKCMNFSGAVIDPCEFPQWVYDRYKLAGIDCYQFKAEDITKRFPKFDESWIYNCAQHTDRPDKVIRNAKKISKLIRIFEWLETKKNIGHPHILEKDKLNIWLGGEGKVEFVNSHTAVGKAYYGIFPTKI